MKQWGLAAVLGTALAANWPGIASSQTGCPATFEGATHKELLACITSIQNSITELKNRGAGVLVVGHVDSAANIQQQSGSIKVTARKSQPNSYEIAYLATQQTKPIVLVGPRTDDLTNVVLSYATEQGFGVVTIKKDGAAPAGFWFAVFSP